MPQCAFLRGAIYTVGMGRGTGTALKASVGGLAATLGQEVSNNNGTVSCFTQGTLPPLQHLDDPPRGTNSGAPTPGEELLQPRKPGSPLSKWLPRVAVPPATM